MTMDNQINEKQFGETKLFQQIYFFIAIGRIKP